MKKEYPDKWVIVDVTKGDGTNIWEGIVKYVATDEEVSAIWIKCRNEKLGYYRERTTVDFGLGIIDCVNFEVV